MTTARELVRLFERALDELGLAERTRQALSHRWDDDAGPPVRIVAMGKGAPAMAAGALVRLRGAVEHCLVVTPDGTSVLELHRAARLAKLGKRLTLMRAGHPLPDARSVRAGKACLASVATDEPRRILVLVSGGASALASAPARGLTLREKRARIARLLRSGASIQELNAQRKRWSRIKGGGLARAAGKNELLTLVASDVIGGTAADVGSGPTIRDAKDLRPSRTKIIASPEELARIFAAEMRAHAMKVVVLPPSQESAEVLAAAYLEHLRTARAGHVFVRAAEPSIVVRGSGEGGRSTHLAALVGAGAASVARRFLFAALATDGVDGPSRTGGAIIDQRFARRVATRLGPEALARALATFATGPLHRALGTSLPTHPSGHNLADLHVLVVL